MNERRWQTQARRRAEPGMRVAIIGGGFAGTMVLANLVSRAPSGTVVEMFDARGAFATGTAYATAEKFHLLNVAAGRMGAFAEGDFVAWLNTAEGAAAAATICPGHAIGPREFLPRALYGRYLEQILNRALAEAAERGIGISLLTAAVTDIRQRGPRLDLHLAKGWRGPFDAVVLATGNQRPRLPGGLRRGTEKLRDFVGDIWSPPQASIFPDGICALSPEDTVLVLGSGLTAVDAILSLQSRGFPGRIIALSRHGRLPAAQASAPPALWTWHSALYGIAPTALGVLCWLKREARAAQKAGSDWRAIFEALRPVTTRLWRELDAAEQKKLLRRHSLWSIHRHRMAPQIAEQMAALQAGGCLQMWSGRILSAKRWFGRWRVRVRRKGQVEILRPKLILNCTGPQYDVGASDSVLYRNLVRRALVHQSENGLGLAINPSGAVRGAAEGRIFAIGTLLFGDRFECTAVPELRETARWVADELAALAPVTSVLERA